MFIFRAAGALLGSAVAYLNCDVGVGGRDLSVQGTHFTCFTSTPVQILTQKAVQRLLSLRRWCVLLLVA
jgi:hypothetical protein